MTLFDSIFIEKGDVSPYPPRLTSRSCPYSVNLKIKTSARHERHSSGLSFLRNMYGDHHDFPTDLRAKRIGPILGACKFQAVYGIQRLSRTPHPLCSLSETEEQTALPRLGWLRARIVWFFSCLQPHPYHFSSSFFHAVLFFSRQ